MGRGNETFVDTSRIRSQFLALVAIHYKYSIPARVPFYLANLIGILWSAAVSHPCHGPRV